MKRAALGVSGWNGWSVISGILLMEGPEANEYDNANQRYAANDNKSWQNPSLRLLGSNAVEDVAESS
ncbi:MAG: hypothetical protein Q8O94_00050 [bacterium]|nr:hypothetical protein [bacterium]